MLVHCNVGKTGRAVALVSVYRGKPVVFVHTRKVSESGNSLPEISQTSSLEQWHSSGVASGGGDPPSYQIKGKRKKRRMKSLRAMP